MKEGYLHYRPLNPFASLELAEDEKLVFYPMGSSVDPLNQFWLLRASKGDRSLQVEGTDVMGTADVRQRGLALLEELRLED